MQRSCLVASDPLQVFCQGHPHRRRVTARLCCRAAVLHAQQPSHCAGHRAAAAAAAGQLPLRLPVSAAGQLWLPVRAAAGRLPGSCAPAAICAAALA